MSDIDSIRARLEAALGQIERGCSFPDDDVQRAIVTVCRKTLAQGGQE